MRFCVLCFLGVVCACFGVSVVMHVVVFVCSFCCFVCRLFVWDVRVCVVVVVCLGVACLRFWSLLCVRCVCCCCVCCCVGLRVCEFCLRFARFVCFVHVFVCFCVCERV